MDLLSDPLFSLLLGFFSFFHGWFLCRLGFAVYFYEDVAGFSLKRQGSPMCRRPKAFNTRSRGNGDTGKLQGRDLKIIILSRVGLSISINFLTVRWERLGVCSKMVIASATVRPRTKLATTPTFRGLMRTPLALALIII